MTQSLPGIVHSKTISNAFVVLKSQVPLTVSIEKAKDASAIQEFFWKFDAAR
jgi:hypothetical protein